MKKVVQSIHRAWSWFLDALFPPKCIICKQEGAWLCPQHRKFSPAPPNEASFEYLENIHAAVKYYDPTTEKLVELFKFRGFTQLADIMAEEIILRVGKDFFMNSILVPIPLHWTRKFWRGFNQADLIAQALQKRIPEAQIQHLLKRHKRTFQQAKLSREARLQNIRDAFSFSSPFGKSEGKSALGGQGDLNPSNSPFQGERNKNLPLFESERSSPQSRGPSPSLLKREGRYILIDDVVASGATLNAAAKVLKQCGVSRVDAVVFARGGK
ncbi:hypothetical protein K9L27_01680 [Candidatus Gracilibacteria bacterium]|nr:hypothetical protein [Candidatus Gracilibacteria bacterium]